MVLKSDKEKVKTLLSETIRLLCKNGLHFKSEFSVEALVGITLDRDQEFFLSIKETVKTDIRPPKPDPPKPPPPRESRQSESRQSLGRDIKGEPGRSPACQRKRPAETTPNDGSTDLPSLSLGDMQEGEQSFWSSVTGDNDTNTNHDPKKKQRLNTNDDDSNSTAVITIKGEPGSDSEEDDGGGGDDAAGDSSQIDMSSSFTYGTPVTSAQTMMAGLPPGNMPGTMPGTWDHLPQFSMAGPSGLSTGTPPGVSPDAQQQMAQLVNANLPGQFSFAPMPIVGAMTAQYEYSSPKRSRPQQTCSEVVVIRNILLSKGKLSTPRIVTMNIRGKQNTAEIVRIMQKLDDEGVGFLVKEDPLPHAWSAAPPARTKAVFLKKPAEDIQDALIKYNVLTDVYMAKYFTDIKENEKHYEWAIAMLERSQDTRGLSQKAQGAEHESSPRMQDTVEVKVESMTGISFGD